MKVLITGASGFIGARLLDAAIAAWGKENVLALSSMKNEKCQTIVYDLQGDGLALAASEVSLLREVTLLIHPGLLLRKAQPKPMILSGAIKIYRLRSSYWICLSQF